MAAMIVITGDASGDAVLVHEHAIANVRLYVKKGDCRVVVHECEHRASDEYEKRASLCRATASTRPPSDIPDDSSAPQSGTYYLYVALWFDKVFIKVSCSGHRETLRMAATAMPHHITLAYLPSRGNYLLSAMADSLNEVCEDWFGSEGAHMSS